jgi:hypothetical protein
MTSPQPPAVRVVETEVVVDLGPDAHPVLAVDVVVPRKPPVSLEVKGDGSATLRIPLKFRLHYTEPPNG